MKLGIVSILVTILAACNGCGASLKPNTVTAGENLGICILDGVAAHKTVEQIALDCDTAVVNVLNTLAALKRAEQAESDAGSK